MSEASVTTRIDARDNLRTPAELSLPMNREQSIREAKRLLFIGRMDWAESFCAKNGLALGQDESGNTIVIEE
jgi:hypothetical protein